MEDLKLTQKSFPFGRLSLEVNDQRQLVFVNKTLFRSDSFSLSIDNLSPRPDFYKKTNYLVIGAFIASIIIVFASILIALNTSSSEKYGQLALVAMIVFGMVLIFTISKLKDSYSNIIILREKETLNNLFTIHRAKPSEEKVDSFLQSLEEKINTKPVKQVLYHDEKTNVILLKFLETLRSEKILSASEHGSIISRLKE